jgi:hypothetical protein
VYGGGLARANDNTHEAVDVCAWRKEQCLAVALAFCAGDAFVLCMGVYVRSSQQKGDPVWKSCLAECCPLCSFAPCQMNDYRRRAGKASSDAQNVQDSLL